jgi:hypothetical protein
VSGGWHRRGGAKKERRTTTDGAAGLGINNNEADSIQRENHPRAGGAAVGQALFFHNYELPCRMCH